MLDHDLGLITIGKREARMTDRMGLLYTKGEKVRASSLNIVHPTLKALYDEFFGVEKLPDFFFNFFHFTLRVMLQEDAPDQFIPWGAKDDHRFQVGRSVQGRPILTRTLGSKIEFWVMGKEGLRKVSTLNIPQQVGKKRHVRHGAGGDGTLYIWDLE